MDEPKKDLLIGIVIFVLDLVLSYYLWRSNFMLTIALFIVSIFVLLFWTNKEEKFLYFIGFILGPIYDIVLVPTGVWTYGNPTIFNVPLWLPLVYGLSIVTLFKIGRAIAKIVLKIK